MATRIGDNTLIKNDSLVEPQIKSQVSQGSPIEITDSLALEIYKSNSEQTLAIAKKNWVQYKQDLSCGNPQKERVAAQFFFALCDSPHSLKWGPKGLNLQDRREESALLLFNSEKFKNLGAEAYLRVIGNNRFFIEMPRTLKMINALAESGQDFKNHWFIGRLVTIANNPTIERSQIRKISRLLKATLNDECSKIANTLLDQMKIASDKRKSLATNPTSSPIDKWPNPSNLKFISNLNTNGSLRLYQDSTTGKKYVINAGKGSSPIEELHSQLYAFQMYEAAGIAVPKTTLLSSANIEGFSTAKTLLMSEYQENTCSLQEYMKNHPSDKERNEMKMKIQAGFAVDALLGNWGVIGADEEHIRIDQNGNPIRVNTASCLFPIDQSKKPSAKLDDENKYAVELWTMRGQALGSNRTADLCNHPELIHYFSELSIFEIAAQIDKLSKTQKNLSSVIPSYSEQELTNLKDLHPILNKRFKQMHEFANQALLMRDDFWSSDYVNGMLKHRMGLKQMMIRKQMPKHLLQDQPGDVVLFEYVDPLTKTEKSNIFSSLRGEEFCGKTLIKYMEQGFYGSPRFLIEWLKSQGGGSENTEPLTVKYCLYKNRTKQNYSEIYWHGNSEMEIQNKYNNTIDDFKIDEDKLTETIQISHAFTQEMLSKVQFPFNDHTNHSVELMRGIEFGSLESIDGNEMTGTDANGNEIPLNSEFKGILTNQKILPRVAVYESHSAFSPLLMEGIIKRTVPHHKIIASYMCDFETKGVGDQAGPFYSSDSENEFLVLTEDLPIHAIADTDLYNDDDECKNFFINPQT